MEILPNNSSCLELTIAMPGFNSSPSLPFSGESGGGSWMKYQILDINQVPLLSGCMGEEDETPNGPTAPRKKLRLSREQSRLLEESFSQNQALNPKEKEVLAGELKLKPRQVEVWFQNRRARSKLKQTEMEFEYMKRWHGTLTEQNRRLKREVDQLRAMKVGTLGGPPQPSAVTMCPRCERITATTHTDKDVAAITTTSSAVAKLHFLQPRQPSAACYN